MFGLMISGFLVQGSRNNVIDRTARTCQPEDRGQKRREGWRERELLGSIMGFELET